MKENMSIGNKYAYQTMYIRPHPKKKTAPTCVHKTNSAAEVILREKKVEIKDLESQVNYLQNQIKVLKIENKTLREVQTRYERELRKFKEGVADIPFLLRSHKEEIKAIESNTSVLRRDLRNCQKELKTRCGIILKKDELVEKLTVSSKRHEKLLQELTAENKELKTEKKKLEEESKKLTIANEETKSENERFQKTIQQLTNKILQLEKKLGLTEHNEIQLKEDLVKLQKSYNEMKQNFPASKLTATKETQTDLSYVKEPKSSKYLETLPEPGSYELEHSSSPENNLITLDTNSKESIDEHVKNYDINSLGDCFKNVMRMEGRTQKPFTLKPLKTKSSLPLNFNMKSCFSFPDQNFPTDILEMHSLMKNLDRSKAPHHKKL